MKKVTRWTSCVVVLALAAICLRPSSGRAADTLRDEIRARSENYVHELGRRPFEALGTEDKLLLLHAHYNLEHYRDVVSIAGRMSAELDELPAERREAFGEMIKDARITLETRSK